MLLLLNCCSHPKFDPKTFEYDLALLRFYEPVTFQPNIIPVCIPGDDETLVGETAWVTGWGRLYEGETHCTPPRRLKKLRNPSLPARPEFGGAGGGLRRTTVYSAGWVRPQ